jgi:hypothetical protein
MYSEVQIPTCVDIKRLIGLGGRHVKNITASSGCHYIWVDSNRRVVEIWGRDDRLAAGIKAVRQRINNLTNACNVVSWESGYRTFYDITGSEEECKKVFDKLSKEYPFNPYMTQIEKKTQKGLLVFRFSSCD